MRVSSGGRAVRARRRIGVRFGHRAGPVPAPTRGQVLDAMKRATTFMVEKVSTEGGYVWTYLA